MSLGNRIREYRQQAKLSQEKVAELVGVSRQAVAKWESGQSAPSTENLFRLAEVFGTTVDSLAASGQGDSAALAEQIHRLCRDEEEKRTRARRLKLRQNRLTAAAVAAGYLAVYLIARLFPADAQNESSLSVIGWLFDTTPGRFRYLYGWLIHTGLFWAAFFISVLPALFGRRRFALTTLSAFTLGLLLGEWLGETPAGAPYGPSHYGWVIWGGFFLASIAGGAVWEHLARVRRRSHCPAPVSALRPKA